MQMNMFVSKNFKTFAQEEKASEDKVSMLEARVKHQQDPELFYKTLVPESDVEKYFRMLDLVRIDRGQNELPQVLKFWKDTEHRSNSGPLRYEVYFKYLVSRLGVEKDPKKRKHLLKEFNDHFLSENLQIPASVSIKSTQEAAPVLKTDQKTKSVVESASQRLQVKLKEAQKSIKTLREACLHREVVQDLQHEALLASAESITDADWYLAQVLPNPTLSAKKFGDIIRAYSSRISKWVRSWNFPHAVTQGSTAEQLEDILTIYDQLPQDFLSHWLFKRFELSSLPPNTLPSQEVLAQILEALAKIPADAKESPAVQQTAAWVNWLRLFPDGSASSTSLASLITQLTTPMQVLPLSSCGWVSQAFRTTLTKTEHTVACPFPCPVTTAAEILTKVFDTLVQSVVTDEKNRTQVLKFVQESVLHKSVSKVKLLAGECVSDVATTFTEIELNTLRDSRVLEFVPTNAKSFEHQQPVKLSVDLKNIRTLQISLFRLNTANCHAGGKEINQNIDLSGLIPSEQQTIKYSQPAMHRHRETFEFPTVANTKRGLFVVELVGEGLCSRTIIKKGGLSLVPVSEHSCHEFVVFSEEGKSCPAAKVEVSDKVFVADENGTVKIPFSTSGLSGSGAISLGDFFEPFSINIPAINWTLEFGAIYNEESLCGGNNLDLVIRPRLFANNIPTSLSILSKVQLLISSSTSENIQTARHFDPSLESLDEIVLNYQLPLKTVSVKVTLKAEIEGILVSSTRNLKTTQSSERDRTLSVVLDKSSEDSFVLKAVGLAGEHIPGLDIKVETLPYFTQITENTNHQTDSEGKVGLGSLVGISELTINYQDCGITVHQKFPLVADARFTGIPDVLDVVEGEDLRLPKLQNLEDAKYVLLRTDASFSAVLTDQSKNIEFEGDVLYCTKLKAGNYLFRVLRGTVHKTIKIKVIAGQRWNNYPEIVMEKQTAHRLQHQSNYLTTDPIKYDPKSEEVTFRVFSNQIEAVKVNILGFQSCPNSLGEIIESLGRLTVRAEHTQYPIRQNCNLYLSEREVGDELKYVVERQQRATFPGNNLEKPSGLLKPQFNRKTQVDTQKTNTAAYFKSSQGQLPAPQSVKVPTVSRAGYNSDWKTQFANNKWLGVRGKVVSAEPDIEGNVSINCSSLKGFSCWVILVQDGNNFVHQLYYPPRSTVAAPKPQEVVLSSSRHGGSVYLHSRTAGVLGAGAKLSLGDASSLSYNTLNEFNHFFDLCLAFQPDLLQFSFLKEWITFTFEEKQKLYEKVAGHELHLFVKEKDPEFFTKVVAPHLKNKFRPTVVDLCVLDSDKLTADEFAGAQHLGALAPWEIALLARHFSKKGDAATHKRVVNYLRLKASTTSSSKQQQYRSQFDTVLHFSAAKTGTGGSDDALTAGSASLQAGQAQVYSGSKKHGNAKMATTTSSKPSKPSSSKPSVYLEIGDTYEYSEREYYLNCNHEHSESAFGFWADMAEAQADPSKPQALLSEKFIEGRPSKTLEALMFCIFQGFPLASGAEVASQSSIQLSTEGGQSHLTNNARSPVLYFVKELVEKKAQTTTHPENSNVFISHSYAPQIQTTREQLSCAQEGKFQSGVVYTCKIVIVSTSAVQMDLELQAEVPQGSIPVKSDNYFFAKPFTLSKYGNYTFEYSFYFPFEGQFSAFPPTLLANGEYLKSTDATNSKGSLTVLKTLPRAEITAHECSLNDLVKQTVDSKGAIIVEDFTQLRKNILDQLEKANPFDNQTANLHTLVPVCAFDRSFFLEVVRVLRSLGIFNRIIWALSLLHDEEQILREYLEYKFPRSKSISMKDFELYYFDNGILRIDGFSSKNYDPVVNSRAHFIEGRAHSINNKEFLDTYMFFLKYLQDKHDVDDRDKLLFAEYLIAQDRMKEAAEILNAIDQKKSPTTVQHDYMRVYCLMSQLNPTVDTISEICTRYYSYPVVTWRNLFVEAANVLLEYKNVSPTEAKLPAQELEGSVAFRNAKNAQQRQTLKAAIEQNQIVIISTNVTSVTLNFYKVDVETKFSIDPFSRQTDSTFGFVSPNLTKTVEIQQPAAGLPQGPELVQVVETKVDLPAELSAFNLCVQVSSESKSLFLNYLPSSYQVVTLKERGLLQVLNNKGQPVSQAYVKVFSCGHNGSEKYHKDGYTDYLGFFDYLSLNLENPSLVKEFSILILGPPNNPGSQILRVTHSANDAIISTGSRLQDLAVEDKLRTLQLEVLSKHQTPEQSATKPPQKANKYAVLLN